MSEGWHVTANSITDWVDKNPREAQETLPLLIRKLIISTTTPSSLRIPAGDSILNKGWDGVLNCLQGNSFVPTGDSFWEMSTEHTAKVKAESDYRKRTANTNNELKAKSIFVLVTSTAWNDPDWLTLKKNQKEWLDIRVINAVDIETWLAQASAVHRWLARLIGKRAEGA
jgi:hypothetical protein